MIDRAGFATHADANAGQEGWRRPRAVASSASLVSGGCGLKRRLRNVLVPVPIVFAEDAIQSCPTDPQRTRRPHLITTHPLQHAASVMVLHLGDCQGAFFIRAGLWRLLAERLRKVADVNRVALRHHARIAEHVLQFTNIARP